MNYVDRVTSKGTVYEISDSEAREVKLDKKDLPTNLSQFKNDIGAIDKTVANLENYYLKSETYTQDEIKDLLSNRLRYLVVTELPTGNFDRNVIYLIQRKSGEEGEQDFYDEYLYIGGDWELIGNTFVDLSDYYRKAEVQAVVDASTESEKESRENADELLNEKIQALLVSLDEMSENLKAETARAEEAELTNRTKAETALENIDIEKERAESAEMALSERVAVAESHIADTSNPHNVTKEQLGLGNVENVGIDTTPMAYSENAVTSGGVFNALLSKVDKVDGKGLSDENFSYAEKVKLEGLENYNDSALSERISANEDAIATLNADSDTEGSVDAKIKAAVEQITQFDFKIVDALPDISEAKKGVIYLIPSKSANHTPPTTDEPTEPTTTESNSSESNGNVSNEEEIQTDTSENESYSEYIFIGDKFEHLGEKTVEMELSEYAKKNEVTALVSVKNDKIGVSDADDTALTDSSTVLSAEAGSGVTAFLRHPLKKIWTYIAKKIADELGLNATQYNGNAKTATNATYAANLGNASASYSKASLDTALNGLQTQINSVKTANNYNRKFYTLNLKSLSTSNFYPVIFVSDDFELDCEIHSENLGGGAPYNQNHIHFLLTSQGWSDTFKQFTVLSYGVYMNNEITIGCIGTGVTQGYNCVWLRGGLTYRFLSNKEPMLKTSTFTVVVHTSASDNEVFTVGTNYYGGSNNRVTIVWNPLTRSRFFQIESRLAALEAKVK